MEMTSDSPLILSFDLQLDYLSLTIFNICGLLPVYTITVQFIDVGDVSHLDNVVNALDKVLEQASSSASSLLSRVTAIATTAATELAVFLTPSAPSALSKLSPSDRLGSQFLQAQAISADKEYASEQLQSRISDATMPSVYSTVLMQSSTIAGTPRGSNVESSDDVESILKSFTYQVCEIAKSPTWNHCGHVLPIGTFLDSLIHGQIGPCNPTQASSTGLFDYVASQWDSATANACSQGKGMKLISMLPRICHIDEALPVGPWLVKRFGFSSECVIVSCIPSLVTGYTSFLPSPDDGALHFDSLDRFVLSLANYSAFPDCSILVNPLHLLDKGSNKPWLAVTDLPNAGQARTIVREKYTKTWKAFNQAVCPGGSVGLDNKLFSLYVTTEPQKGLRRFEHGTRVAEFEDLRANPRCIVEGQAMQIRRVTSLIKSQDQGRSEVQEKEYRGAAGCLSFSPYDASLKVLRWYTWGRAAGNERIAEIYAQVLGAPIMADETEVMRCAQETDTHASMTDRVTRPSLGACFIAAYILEQNGSVNFNTCINTLMKRTSMGRSNQPLRRTRSTLACVKEDESDLGSQLTAANSSIYGIDLCPTLNVRPKRSVTVSVNSSQYTSLSIAARERSSSVTSTSLLAVSSPFLHSSRYDDTSLPTSPREFSSPPRVQAGGDNAAVLGPGRRGTIQLAEPDDDLWQFYGSLLEEYIRLSDMVNETSNIITNQL